MASSGRASTSAAAGLDPSLYGYAMLMGIGGKLSTSSSGDSSSDESSSSSSSGSDSGNSDVASAGPSQSKDVKSVPSTSSAAAVVVGSEPLAGPSQSNDIESVPSTSGTTAVFVRSEPPAGPSHSRDIESVPSTSGAPAVVVRSEPQIWIQPNLVRPADFPSDHPDQVHDWSDWPQFPPKKMVDPQRAIVDRLPAMLPRVTLVNHHEFLRRRIELLIHTQGRFMKPAPEFRITNLVDKWQYTVWLTFTDYTGRQCVGQYCHPDSPRPGFWLYGRVLSFSKLKLFSNEKNIPNPPPISLRSCRTYRIQVNVGIVDDYGHIISASVVRQSVGDRFIAVAT
ncbi:optomotor-blind protein-like [Dermacentor albipictus]|uniref:optomotor-blind protein-like n=1 Tax=Dermacentor albipictus TaxID=60249 RepID=UPI0038FC4C4E